MLVRRVSDGENCFVVERNEILMKIEQIFLENAQIFMK